MLDEFIQFLRFHEREETGDLFQFKAQYRHVVFCPVCDLPNYRFGRNGYTCEILLSLWSKRGGGRRSAAA
jgi:hypothetical protein